jgi:hypothetical protein
MSHLGEDLEKRGGDEGGDAFQDHIDRCVCKIFKRTLWSYWLEDEKKCNIDCYMEWDKREERLSL